MALLGWGVAGASGTGPSKLFDSLPFAGWRDLGPGIIRGWVQEFIDAIGIEYDVAAIRFANAAARAELLDPTAVPDMDATASLATVTTAPTDATSTDTMLDLMCYIAGTPTPVNTNLSTANKQALIEAGWELLRYKGNRIPLLRVAAMMGNGVGIGWSPGAGSFSAIIPDGEPSAGWGTWVQSTAALVEVVRPWTLSAVREHWMRRLFPAWCDPGVGFSQFRAGYSGAGEPTFATGTRVGLAVNSSFSGWTAGAPDNWTVVDASAAGAVTENTAAPAINWEFADSAVSMSLVGAANGDALSISQSVTVNNQVAHRFEIDYTSRQAAAPFLARLTGLIYDSTNATYYDPATESWGAAIVEFPIPVSDTTTARARYAFDFALNAASATATTRGTHAITVTIRARCDGTATTTIDHTIYRCDVFELLSVTDEEDAGGDRTLWLPLLDAPGRTTLTRAAGTAIYEPANALGTAYKSLAYAAATQWEMPHRRALTARGYRSSSTWTNVCVDGTDFAGASWTATNCTRTGASDVSPIVGETVATAPRFTATAAASYITAGAVAGLLPTGVESFTAGVYAKKLTGDTTAGAGTVATTIGSAALTGTGTAFTADWVGRYIAIGTATYQVLSVGGGTAITLTSPATATVSGSAYTVSTDDITITLTAVGGTAYTQTFKLLQGDGWKWLPFAPVTFLVGDLGRNLTVKIALPSVSTSAAVALAAGYLYDVTGKTGVLYPPIAPTTALVYPGVVGATALATTISGANLHPIWLRRLTSLATGAVNLSIVPTFSAASTPNGQTIFDFGEGAAVNRLRIHCVTVAGTHKVRMRMWDSAGATTDADVTLSSIADPSAGTGTWVRDTLIELRARWYAGANGYGLFLSVGNGYSATTSATAKTVSDAALAGISIGSSFTGGGSFDGVISDVELLACGATP